MKAHRFFLAFVLCLVPRLSFGAACCGGSSNFPSLITTNTLTQAAFGMSYGSIQGRYRSDLNEIIETSETDVERTITQTLSVSQMLTDRFQVGLEVPLLIKMVEMNQAQNSKTSFGDVSFHASFEYWPEYEKSAWKPKGFLALQWTLPTGTAFQESTESLAADVTGQGQHQVSLSHFWIKSFSRWDVFWRTQFKLFLPATLNQVIKVPARTAGSTQVGFGFSPKKTPLRFGAFIAPQYESRYTSDSPFGGSTTNSRFLWNVGVQASYLASDSLSLSLSFQDESLIRWFTTNPIVSRSISINLQHRWLM